MYVQAEPHLLDRRQAYCRFTQSHPLCGIDFGQQQASMGDRGFWSHVRKAVAVAGFISSFPPSLPPLRLSLPSIPSSPPSLPPLHLFLPSISPHPPFNSRWCTSSLPLHSGSLSVTGAPEIRLSSALPPLMAMSACTLCWEEKGAGPVSQLNNG